MFINLGIYIFLTRYIHWPFEGAAVIAIGTSVISNFLMSNLWNLRTEEGPLRLFYRLVKYHKIAFPGAAVNFAVLLAAVYELQMYDIYANLIGILCSIIVNYCMNAFFSWRELETE